MDKVIGHRQSDAESEQATEAKDSASAALQTSQHDLSETVEKTGKVDYNLHDVAQLS